MNSIAEVREALINVCYYKWLNPNDFVIYQTSKISGLYLIHNRKNDSYATFRYNESLEDAIMDTVP